jgi:dTDP-4-dehydrorhamnose reductase
VTLLVVGASGLLGGNVVATARRRDERVRGTYLTADPAAESNGTVTGSVAGTFAGEGVETVRFDVTGGTGTDLGSLLDGVDRVVDCAAVTDVDACETDPERARAVNAAWPGRLATACAERGIPLCHVSTDYVFGGRDPPYTEGDDPNPLQVYGETKLAGERAVRDAGAEGPEPLVLRVSFLWDVDRTAGTLAGFPAWIASELRAGGTVPLFDDQRVTPTRAGYAARVALDLFDAGSAGTYHVAARDCRTPFEFGERVAARMGADAAGRVERSSMCDLDRPATRPAATCLDVSKLEGELGRDAPTLDEDLEAVERAGHL